MRKNCRCDDVERKTSKIMRGEKKKKQLILKKRFKEEKEKQTEGQEYTWRNMNKLKAGNRGPLTRHPHCQKQ